MTTLAELPVQAPGQEPPREVRATFRYAGESAGQARQLVKDALRSWGLTDPGGNAVLVSSELMANAIQTGCRRRIDFSIIRTDDISVRIAVTDGSCYPPVFIDAGLPASWREAQERGRGLLVVKSLSQKWGLQTAARGKTVYADLRLGQRLH